MKSLWLSALAAALWVGCQSYPMGLSEAQWKALSPEQHVEFARRWGTIDDFGGIAVYLASDASSYTTGEQFVIDGGYTKF